MGDKRYSIAGRISAASCSLHSCSINNSFCWQSERGAEIDFVIQRDGQLIPIEVKSADNTKAKSLKVYMDTYKPAYAIKISAKNFGFEDNKKIVPLYAAFCI